MLLFYESNMSMEEKTMVTNMKGENTHPEYLDLSLLSKQAKQE
jgi:hypothetical protein